tara:strand:- start:31 stop:363 length:333 start_codon:yes stop_codon:yes gene_type:complete
MYNEEQFLKIKLNNEVIAKFMGVEIALGINSDGKEKPTIFWINGWIESSDLKYSISWNWLIPVVEKFKEKKIIGSEKLINDIENRIFKLDLFYTYEEVVNIIKYHNKNLL